MNKRAVILTTAILCGFALVVLRLADLMLRDHERLSERARSQYSTTKDVRASRGTIYDRRGRELAVNVDAVSTYLKPREIEDPRRTAAALARVTGEDYRQLLRRASSDKSFAWAARKMEREEAEEVRSLGLKGVEFKREVKRFYPKGRLAAHVVGFVGIDNQALEGIELRYDDYLQGRSESVPVVRDARNRTLSEGQPVVASGGSVILTLDEGLQYIVERALDRAVERWQAASATAVMMDPYTGEILAMANRPTYDLNGFWTSPAAARRNRAITDTYEPGSTFKVITAAAALEAGLVEPTTRFDCSDGFIRVAGRAYWDTHNHGELNFKEVIQTSSNVGTIMLGLMAGSDRLQATAAHLGFGRHTDVDLPGESPGKLKRPGRWSDTDLASASIGYGVAVTPLQILRAYAAIANGGFLVKPFMVSDVISPEGAELYRHRSGEREPVLSRRTTAVLRDILVSVTEEGGTATGASVAGNRVAGKTGTARLIDPETGAYSTERYASSFVGFAPAENPRIALVVVVFEPQDKYYGGQVAAPVFQEIVDKSLSYLNVPREDAFDAKLLVVRAQDL
jgi:cell division protein FtsI (penicillin-binding protein 3)